MKRDVFFKWQLFNRLPHDVATFDLAPYKSDYIKQQTVQKKV